MWKRSPVTLAESSLRPLVLLTISTLQRCDLGSRLSDPILPEEIAPPDSTKKRKLVNNAQYSHKQRYARKRTKREATPFPHHIFLQSDEKSEVSESPTTNKSSSIVNEIICLRDYFDCMPQNLWNRFFCLTLKALNTSEIILVNSRIKFRAFDFLFGKKVSMFSTRLISFDFYDKYENLLFDRIRLCRNLKSLEIHYKITPDYEQMLANSLSKLTNVRTLILLPDKKQSMHSLIPIISESCRQLEELTITYASECMSSKTKNISCLKHCTKVRKLSLFSYGKGCEVKYILVIMNELSNLNHFYHRELPHAITDICSKYSDENNNKTLNLKSLILSAYTQCTGSQLCYLPEESFVQIASICPFIEHLRLIKPPNLSPIVLPMPLLVGLHIHDCDIKESFTQCSSNGSLNKLVSLHLINTIRIEYRDFQILSDCCTGLQELEILNSNLFWSNNLNHTRYLFPRLRKLRILKIPAGEQNEPRFVIPHTLHVGKTLTNLLLSGFESLEKIHLEFDHVAVMETNKEDIPNKEELITWIGRCRNLRELMLLNCPEVDYPMIKAFVKACPFLIKLLDIELWGLSPAEMEILLMKYSYMFIQSHTNS